MLGQIVERSLRGAHDQIGSPVKSSVKPFPRLAIAYLIGQTDTSRALLFHHQFHSPGQKGLRTNESKVQIAYVGEHNSRPYLPSQSHKGGRRVADPSGPEIMNGNVCRQLLQQAAAHARQSQMQVQPGPVIEASVMPPGTDSVTVTVPLGGPPVGELLTVIV